MEEVKLFGAWSSSFSYRIIWALNHKCVNYEYIEEDLTNKSENLLKYNTAYKKIPVLVHGGKPISESAVILEYIEETWPQNPLLPKDPYEKAMARFWIKFQEDKEPNFFAVFHNVGEKQIRASNEVKELLKVIEERGLGENKFFGGDNINMVDLIFGWIAVWLDVLEEAGGVKLLEPTCFPRLQKWMKNFKSVPIVSEKIPNHDELLVYYKQIREKIIQTATEKMQK